MAIEPAWHALLRRARESAGLTREALVARAGVSPETVTAYELRRRPPTHDTLTRIMRALPLDSAGVNRILTAAGSHPEPSGALTRLQQRRLAPTSLAEALAEYGWPCLVVGGGCDIVAGNEAMARVLTLDLRRGVQDPRRRNLVRFFLSREFRDRIVNWDEAVTAVVPRTLRRVLGSEHVPPALQPLVEALGREEPDLLPELQALWQSVPPPVLCSRVAFPLIWRHTEGTALAFNVVLSLWDSRVPSWVFDWHPADAATWRWLTAAR